MPITIYGIKNCDTMKKARAFLDKQGVDYAFHDYKSAGIERDRHRVRQREILTDLNRRRELTREHRRAGIVVVADRLFEPRHAFGFQCAAARERFGPGEGLVVVDQQRDGVRQPRPDGTRHGQVFGQMPDSQKPNYYVVGEPNPAFEAQTPFRL